MAKVAKETLLLTAWDEMIEMNHLASHSLAGDINTAKKQKQKAPIPYSVLDISSNKDRKKVFALVLHTNQIW